MVPCISISLLLQQEAIDAVSGRDTQGKTQRTVNFFRSSEVQRGQNNLVETKDAYSLAADNASDFLKEPV